MSEDLQARLTAAKAARNALKAKVAELSEADALADEVAREELALADETAIAALRVQYGANKIAVVQTDLGAIVVVRSGSAAFKRFVEKPDFKMEDVEQLVRPCVKHPAVTRFDAIIEELPGALPRCADAIAHLAGVRKSELSGK